MKICKCALVGKITKFSHGYSFQKTVGVLSVSILTINGLDFMRALPNFKLTTFPSIKYNESFTGASTWRTPGLETN